MRSPSTVFTTAGLVAIMAVGFLALAASKPALAAQRIIVASFAHADDIPIGYVLTFGGQSYLLDPEHPLAEIGYSGGPTRIVVQELPSCRILADERAQPGGHYELVFDEDGFSRMQKRGGFDAASIIPPKTEACGLPPTESLNAAPPSRETASPVLLIALSLIGGGVAWFWRNRRRSVSPRST